TMEKLPNAPGAVSANPTTIHRGVRVLNVTLPEREPSLARSRFEQNGNEKSGELAKRSLLRARDGSRCGRFELAWFCSTGPEDLPGVNVVRIQTRQARQRR